MCSRDNFIDSELKSSSKILDDIGCRQKLLSNTLTLNSNLIDSNVKDFVKGMISSMIMGCHTIELPIYQIIKKLNMVVDFNPAIRNMYQSVDFSHPIFNEKLVPIIIRYLKNRRSLAKVMNRIREIATNVILTIDRNPIINTTTNFDEYNIAYGREINRLLGTVFDQYIVELSRYYNFTAEEYNLRFYLNMIDENQGYSYDFSLVEDSNPEIDTTDEDYLMIIKADEQIKISDIYNGVKRYAQRKQHNKILEYLQSIYK